MPIHLFLVELFAGVRQLSSSCCFVNDQLPRSAVEADHEGACPHI